MQLGIAVSGPDGPDAWAALRRRAVQADELGFHSLWVPEGHFTRGGTASPLLVLSALAVCTRRLRLATTSLLLPIHHPLRLAEEVAALDHLSGGRALLGLGRGFRPALFRAFGIAARSKRDRFDEALEALLAAWRGEPIVLSGSHFAAGDGPVRACLRPLQTPHPPLVVAAFGPKGLAQAARHALPYLASPLETLDTLAENLAQHRAALSGPLPEGVPHVPVLRTLHVAGDDAEAGRVLDALRSEVRPGLRDAPGALARAAQGALEDRVLVGTLSAVRDRIAQYRERIGLDLLIARTPVPGCSAQEQRASLERLVEAVPS